VVTGNVSHRHPLRTVEVDLETRHDIKQVLQRNRGLHARRRDTESAWMLQDPAACGAPHSILVNVSANAVI
jgi:hypothetical protein